MINLTSFLAKYRVSDNEWWKLSSGDMQNLFDEAVEKLDALEKDRELRINKWMQLSEDRDRRIAELADARGRIEKIKGALQPFSHPDLCMFMSGNCEGIASIVFVRNSAVLRIRDFQNARVALGHELE